MISVKTFSYLVAFTSTSFPLSSSANPIDTSTLSDNLFEKKTGLCRKHTHFPYPNLPQLMYLHPNLDALHRPTLFYKRRNVMDGSAIAQRLEQRLRTLVPRPKRGGRKIRMS